MIIVEVKNPQRSTLYSASQVDLDQESKQYTIITQSGIERGRFTEYSKQVRDGYYLIKIQETK